MYRATYRPTYADAALQHTFRVLTLAVIRRLEQKAFPDIRADCLRRDLL